jgi:uncharacterized protein with PIN domain
VAQSVSGYFLDTSALAKLYHQEDGSQYLEQLVTTSGSNTFISRLSLVELESVFAIKIRTGELNSAGREMARRRLRADVAQGRIWVGPPIHEQHYRRARRSSDQGIARQGRGAALVRCRERVTLPESRSMSGRRNRA